MSLPATYSVADVAPLIGKSENWLAVEARRKRIPHLRVGVAIRFTEAQVAELIASFEVRPGTSAQNVRGLTARSAAHAQRAGRTS